MFACFVFPLLQNILHIITIDVLSSLPNLVIEGRTKSYLVTSCKLELFKVGLDKYLFVKLLGKNHVNWLNISKEYLHNWGRIILEFWIIWNLKLLVFNLRNDHREGDNCLLNNSYHIQFKTMTHCVKYTVTQHKF